ncbi:MAG: c-type cytochrome [Deltaproteobacteria bacterium]|nr:MAG: c-type cytochrome [Deltaproteobacteria bacterium]
MTSKVNRHEHRTPLRPRLFQTLAGLALLLAMALVFVVPGCSGGPTGQENTSSEGGDGPDGGLNDRTGNEGSSVVLKAVGVVPAFAEVGKPVTMDAAGSEGAVSYKWSFGTEATKPVDATTSKVEVTYTKAGRYRVFLEVFDAESNREFSSFSIAVVHPTVHQPRQSTTILRLEGASLERVAVVSPDSNEVMILERDKSVFKVLQRYPTGKNPRTIAQKGEWLVTACQDDNTLHFYAMSDGSTKTLSLGYGARPYGVIALGDALYVTLQGKGEVASVSFTPQGEPKVLERFSLVADARGIASLPDGRLVVSRWRSKDKQGKLVVLDPKTKKTEDWSLQFDPQAPSDTEIGGVPNYLNQILVSPSGLEVAIPSLQANIRDGSASTRSGTPIRDDTTLRGIISYIGLPDGKEAFEKRRQFDSRGFLSAGVFTRRGDYLYVAARGAQTIERVDRLTGVASGTIFQVGYAPEGLALSADDRYLYVNSYMARKVVVFDVSSFDTTPKPIESLTIPTKEPLSPELLLGKRLFNDSSDTRLSKENYIACAHCHLEGDSDHLVWDFTQRGEGLRNTISLLGRKGTGDGPIHWSGNFDEIQDFEHDIRAAFGGKGLMSDEQFQQGTRNQTLGDKKAGVSKDLDALAAYLASLQTHRQSPHRTDKGALSESALRGKTLFESSELGCVQCHKGARLTDSSFESPGKPLLHDVGTLKPTSGKRLNQELKGIDTPTLHGLWDSSPYLHDGSAQTLNELFSTRNTSDKHGKTSQLSAQQRDDLVQYLLSLDGKTD